MSAYLMYTHLTWVYKLFPSGAVCPQGYKVYNVYTLSCTSIDNQCYTWYLFMLNITDILLHVKKFKKEVGIDYIKSLKTNQTTHEWVDKSDLQVYPYFWLDS